MRTIEVIIKGTRAILFNNPAGMLNRTAKASKNDSKAVPTAEEEAAKSCYWMPDKTSIGFPGMNIQSAMIAASSRYKTTGKKTNITPYVAGCVEIDPEIIPFGTKHYEIDTRRAVVQRQGIARSRAKLARGWKLAFTILVDEDWPMREIGILQEVLEEAGRRVGIGDYRPQKRGPFGKFFVERFQEVIKKSGK